MEYRDDVSGLYDHIGYWHDRFNREIHTRFERRLAAFEVTVSQWYLLAVLYQGQADTVREIAEIIRLDGGAITRLCDRLQQKGLVRRRRDRSDARSVTLQLTPEGQELVPRLAARADEHDEAHFGILSDGEVDEYNRLLAKLLRALETEDPGPLA